ncbi:hypothetical protein CERSUDRAFT_57604 [Gelatoporia subvermispora B]|uniref:Signal recognition particle subunit SRP72 n=1 Tax=Ceriporiopsis subvermispora (strain B) TaxID=914234 RepID=M2R3W9_CERS8|nr:hypothetical protein CERSUDRAFT_57604 [Gelatoporia subvermispora B]
MPPKPSTKPQVKKQSGGSSAKVKDKAQRKPKQPLPAPDRLRRLFTSLCAQIDGGHFANAIKTCDKILRLEPNDPDAIQTKLFLLLQTEQYVQALALVETLDASSALKADFNKAYSQYRLHNETEATNVLDAIKERRQQGGEEDDRGVIHLEAQLAYREGAYQTAFDLYTQLLDTAEPHSEEHSDLMTNLAAAQAHLDFLESGYRNALGTLPASAVSALESAPPPLLPAHFPLSLVAQGVPRPEEAESDQKEKRIRMKRVPKNVVLGVTPPPDPERWLKKSERSTFTTQSKRRKGGGGATQGVVEKENTGSGGAGGKGRRKKREMRRPSTEADGPWENRFWPSAHGLTESSHLLGSYLRNEYLAPESSDYIRTMRAELVDLNQVHVRVKVGGEGSAVFDSATAVLQGLFPPTPLNKIELANETTITAPLGGYQYVPVETVEPSNDRSLESWTDCPNFQKHIKQAVSSEAFKAMEKKAQPFLNDIRDYLWGREATLENAVWDYVNSELVHNRTYAHRLPPTFIEQARALANFRENMVFSDKQMGGIGNIASRTALSSVLGALQRIAFNGDPLQFMLIETTYQPFISLFHQTEIVKQHPELQAIPDYGSALAIELRRAAPPDARDFLRFKFRNGTDGAFHTLHVFNHHEDIPLTEFIYRLENSVIQSNGEWAEACGVSSAWALPEAASITSGNRTVDAVCGASLAFLLVLLAWFVTKAIQRVFMRKNYVRLQGEEVCPSIC